MHRQLATSEWGVKIHCQGSGEGFPGVTGKGSGPRTENQTMRASLQSARLRT